MKLLTKYSLVNLLVMVAIFLISSMAINTLTKTILITEMDNDLGGIEKKVTVYVNQYKALPQGYPLDEEQLSFVATGIKKTARTSQLVQMYSEREKKMHNYRKLVFPLWFNNNWYKVTLAKPVEGMHHLSRALITISLTTIVSTILIFVVMNSLLLRRLWRPFYASMDIMRNFKLGRTESLSFPKTNIEEFSFMNESLLMATEKAEQDYLLLKEFTENASHEMQTPLSIIRSKLDMLIQEKNLSEKQSELARAAYAAIKRLSRLNQSLLLLAKIENQQFNNVQNINVKEVAEEKIMQFRELWQSHNISVKHTLNDSFIQISPELLEILMNNLFSNASNYNIPSGSIAIDLHAKQFSISNTSNMGALDEKRLFSRFYKESVNSNANSLGLAIIKQISKFSLINIAYRFTGTMHAFTLTWQ